MIVSAACHIHSEWSYDGKWSLPALAAEFGDRGYRVLMITEHDRGFTSERLQRFRKACHEASSEHILVVPGIEYSDADNLVHVLVWGPVPFLGENLPTSELLKTVRVANGVAVLAHPSRRDAWRRYDPTWSSHLLAIETWNRKTDGWAPSRDALRLARKTNIRQFVGMDFHNRAQLFPLTMRLELENPVSEEGVLHSLRTNHWDARAIGSPLDSLSNGWKFILLQVAERCRRSVATTIRRVRKR